MRQVVHLGPWSGGYCASSRPFWLFIHEKLSEEGKIRKTVQNVNLQITNVTSYNVIQASVNVLEKRGSLYN